MGIRQKGVQIGNLPRNVTITKNLGAGEFRLLSEKGSIETRVIYMLELISPIMFMIWSFGEAKVNQQ